MNPWDGFLLGMAQGLTEFLPVSSSGHLVLGQALLGIEQPGFQFEIALHIATLLSVLVVYRDRSRWLLLGVGRREWAAIRYVALLAVATVPAGLVGTLLWDRIGALFEDPAATGLAFLLTAAILASSAWALRRPLDRSLGLRIALLMGLAQAVAIVPGVSRSGATVVAGLWLGLPAAEAAAFSFLLSVPAILGAGTLIFLRGNEVGAEAGVGMLPTLVGAVAAAAFGILAIRIFVKMLKERTFPRFTWYVGPLGLIVLLWGIAG